MYDITRRHAKKGSTDFLFKWNCSDLMEDLLWATDAKMKEKSTILYFINSLTPW